MASVTKRTSKQIEADYLRIKEAAKTAKSWSEIENITGLSRVQISTSLKRHPITNKRIQEQLLNNKNNVDTSNITAEEKEDAIIVQETTTEVQEAHTNAFDFDTNSRAYVIDASITEFPGIIEKLKEICNNKGIIILTSITIKELAKLQHTPDAAGFDAIAIMNMAIENPDVFKCVLIDETVGNPDFCIINYCNQYKDKVILWTADKEMDLLAKAFSIKEEYFKKPKNTSKKSYRAFQPTTEKIQNIPQEINTPALPSAPIKVSPFSATKNRVNRLVINDFEDEKKLIRVWSRGKLHCKGPYVLRVGDSVMVATLEEDNVIDFKVYLVISTSATDEYKIQFHKKFYKHVYISDGRYRDLVYAAKKKFNIK